MAAIHNLFNRLRELLPANEVQRLEALYRRDAADDVKASRQRTKARQAALRLARTQRQEADQPEEEGLS